MEEIWIFYVRRRKTNQEEKGSVFYIILVLDVFDFGVEIAYI